MKRDPNDPRGLIRESYRIDGISEPECRSIFLDWALGIPHGVDISGVVAVLLEQYSQEPADHPMTKTLRAALLTADTPRRRGGRAGRMNG